LGFKRALVTFQKGIFCKPIGHVLEAKRPCVGFDVYKKSLQLSVNKETSCFLEVVKYSNG